MNSRKDRETLDDLFRYGLAAYRDVHPPRELKAKTLRGVQQRARGLGESSESLLLRLGERPMLRRISNAFREELLFSFNRPTVLPAMNLLNRHILAVRLF